MKPKHRDFRLDIIVLLGSITAVTIATFGVYRGWQGQWSQAGFDLAVVLAVSAPVVYAWRTGDSLRAGNVLAALNSAATFGACLLLGHTALTWTYLVLLTNFFIAHRWMAVVCNTLLIVGMQLIPGFFHDGVHAASVLVSASLITVFSLIFASRTQDDRVQLERLAAIDALTGVPNRRSMERALADAVGRFQRGERRFALRNNIHRRTVHGENLVLVVAVVRQQRGQQTRITRMACQRAVLGQRELGARLQFAQSRYGRRRAHAGQQQGLEF